MTKFEINFNLKTLLKVITKAECMTVCCICLTFALYLTVKAKLENLFMPNVLCILDSLCYFLSVVWYEPTHVHFQEIRSKKCCLI